MVHWLVLQLVRGAGFLISHFPPSILPRDTLVIGLVWVERLLVLPRHAMLAVWPGESTPGWLLVATIVLNSLLWAALCVAVRSRTRP